MGWAFDGNPEARFALQLWRKVVQVSFEDVHTIRQKLQIILAVNDGPNAPIVDRSVKEIDKLLPRPSGEWFRSGNLKQVM